MTGALTLPGYQIEREPFYTSGSTHIYKGLKEGEDSQEVMIKLSVLQASQKQNERLRLEYQLAVKLGDDHAFVKALECLSYEHSYALIFEYYPFPSLKDILNEKQKLPLRECLILSLKIAKALQAVHDKEIIHKDINPSNILCDLETKTIKLIDFSSAINLPKEYASLDVKHLEGTLAYLAPEQSGRMNRGIDYRCDHYSLGVTLYQMLTGTLPFKGQDTLDILYQHMAIAAKPPQELNPNIPEVVSDIVMKLMRKTCEERYQSLYGLIYDLEECLRQLDEKGAIVSFRIATEDRYHRFQIPEKLYGREAEIKTLMQAYKKAITGEAASCWSQVKQV